jgi:hypothetical protein
MPGAWPNPNSGGQNANEGGHAANDWQQQLHLLELENARRLHDQRVRERQQADRMLIERQNANRMQMEMNVNTNNQQVHPAYRDFEQEMRQMGFQPGR